MDIIIRPMKAEDTEAIRNITLEVFGPFSTDCNVEKHFGLLNGTTWQERKLRALDDDLQAKTGNALVAELGGEVVGYVTTRLDHHTRVGRIVNLAVASGVQRRGIGRRLLTAALDHLRNQGMEHAAIETLEQNLVAQHLYPSVGFREVSRLIKYFMKL